MSDFVYDTPLSDDLVDATPTDLSPQEQVERGTQTLEGLVNVHRRDPSGEALYKAIQALPLHEAQGMLLLAVVGIAESP